MNLKMMHIIFFRFDYHKKLKLFVYFLFIVVYFDIVVITYFAGIVDA